jgi:hypothetical protein
MEINIGGKNKREKAKVIRKGNKKKCPPYFV